MTQASNPSLASTFALSTTKSGLPSDGTRPDPALEPTRYGRRRLPPRAAQLER